MKAGRGVGSVVGSTSSHTHDISVQGNHGEFALADNLHRGDLELTPLVVALLQVAERRIRCLHELGLTHC